MGATRNVIGAVVLTGAMLVPAAGAQAAHLQPATNDDFATATAIEATPYDAVANTVFATAEADEPLPGCDGAVTPLEHTVWWTWTPSASGTYVVSTQSDDFAFMETDTHLAVYTGTSLDALTEVACDDNDGSSLFGYEDGSAVLEVDVTAGTTYHLQVSQQLGGMVALHVVDPEPAANDDFANAVQLDETTLPYSQDWYGGSLTSEVDEPELACGSDDPGTMWFTYTAGRDATIVFDATDSHFDETIQVFSGTDFDDMVQESCFDDDDDAWFSGGNSEVMLLEVFDGETYHVRLNEYDDESLGRAHLEVFELVAPANDDFADATVVTTLPFSDDPHLGAATIETDEVNCGSVAETVWYAYTPEADGALRVTTLGGPMDTAVGIYTGDAVDALSEVVCRDDSGYALQEDVGVPVDAGTTYWIQVSTMTGESDTSRGWRAHLELELLPDDGVAPNDDFADAITVGQLPWSDTQALYLGTNQGSGCGDAAFPEAWYRFDVPADGDYWLTTFGTIPDSELGVFTGGAVDALTQVACNDDWNQLYASGVRLDGATAGDTYWVVVTGHGATDQGEYVLSVMGGATVAGTVTTEAGDPVANGCVEVWSADGATMLASTTTDDTGGYVVGGLPEEDVKVLADECADTTPVFTAQWFDGAATIDDADAVTLVNATTVIADFVLNQPPIAGDDTATTTAGTPVDIDLLANDTDPDPGDTLEVVALTGAANGAVACDEGVCTYTPDDGFAGDDGFTYEVSDGQDTASGSVTISVTEAGVAPVSARLAGGDRIDTAILVSRRTYPAGGIDTVVLARSDKYPDALSGGPLAVALDAPILLTPTSGLDPRVAAEIERLGATKAVLLGGTVALSAQVETDLAAAGITGDDVRRHDGATRFDTAVKVAEHLGEALGAAPTSAFVVEGDDPDPSRGWPDAVSVGPAAGGAGEPILLVTTDEVPAATADGLVDLGIDEVTVVGGPVAVSLGVQADLVGIVDDVERVFGGTRYDTAIAVAETYRPAVGEPLFVWFATGRNFPDALTAGPAVVAEGAVMVLVHGNDVDGSPATYEWIDANVDDITGRVLVGGTVAIDDGVEAKIDAALQ